MVNKDAREHASYNELTCGLTVCVSNSLSINNSFNLVNEFVSSPMAPLRRAHVRGEIIQLPFDSHERAHSAILALKNRAKKS